MSNVAIFSTRRSGNRDNLDVILRRGLDKGPADYEGTGAWTEVLRSLPKRFAKRGSWTEVLRITKYRGFSLLLSFVPRKDFKNFPSRFCS